MPTFVIFNGQIMYYYEDDTIFQFMIQTTGLPIHKLTTVKIWITKIHMHDRQYKIRIKKGYNKKL